MGESLLNRKNLYELPFWADEYKRFEIKDSFFGGLWIQDKPGIYNQLMQGWTVYIPVQDSKNLKPDNDNLLPRPLEVWVVEKIMHRDALVIGFSHKDIAVWAEVDRLDLNAETLLSIADDVFNGSRV